MDVMITITYGELCKQLPIEPIVEMTQPGWKTFSCKRRLNEICDSKGLDMLEEGIRAAHSLYEDCVHKYQIQIEANRYARLKVLLPWVASVVYYGVTGKKIIST